MATWRQCYEARTGKPCPALLGVLYGYYFIGDELVRTLTFLSNLLDGWVVPYNPQRPDARHRIGCEFEFMSMPAWRDWYERQELGPWQPLRRELLPSR
jgi:hypothetical protein